MRIADSIKPGSVLIDVACSIKNDVLRKLSVTMNTVFGCPAHLVWEVLQAQERLGSTGFGKGIALPHGRVKFINSTIGVFFRLKNPIDFFAIDERPVDLVFAFLFSEKEPALQYMGVVSRVARLFREPEVVHALRTLQTQEEVLDLLMRY